MAYRKTSAASPHYSVSVPMIQEQCQSNPSRCFIIETTWPKGSSSWTSELQDVVSVSSLLPEGSGRLCHTFLGLTQFQALALKIPHLHENTQSAELQRCRPEHPHGLPTPWMPAPVFSVQLLDCLGLLWGCFPRCCSQEVLSLMWRYHTEWGGRGWGGWWVVWKWIPREGGASGEGGDHTK